MELCRAATNEVIFSVMYPSVFASLCNVTSSTQTMEATCNSVDRDAILQIEKQLLADLRVCSEKTFARFKDEFDVMFASSVTEPYASRTHTHMPSTTNTANASTTCKLNLHLSHKLDDSCHVQAGTVQALEVMLCPTHVIVKPGRVYTSWSLDPVHDPMSYELPVTFRANQALGRTAKAKRLLETLEERVKSDANHAEAALLFLEEHGFLGADNGSDDNAQ